MPRLLNSPFVCGLFVCMYVCMYVLGNDDLVKYICVGCDRPAGEGSTFRSVFSSISITACFVGAYCPDNNRSG